MIERYDNIPQLANLLPELGHARAIAESIPDSRLRAAAA